LHSAHDGPNSARTAQSELAEYITTGWAVELAASRRQPHKIALPPNRPSLQAVWKYMHFRHANAIVLAQLPSLANDRPIDYLGTLPRDENN
jgi:hypothetical protein